MAQATRLRLSRNSCAGPSRSRAESFSASEHRNPQAWCIAVRCVYIEHNVSKSPSCDKTMAIQLSSRHSNASLRIASGELNPDWLFFQRLSVFGHHGAKSILHPLTTPILHTYESFNRLTCYGYACFRVIVAR